MRRGSFSDLSIDELLGRARAGEQGALEELFRRARRRIGAMSEKHVARRSPGVARPSDVAQETALRAFEKFPTFHGTTEREWLAWLDTVFRSRTAQSFRDARRKKRGAPGVVPLDDPEAMEAGAQQKSPSQSAAAGEEWRLLFTHIYNLPAHQRDAIVLCHLKEQPVAEVARQMGKTEIAVAGLLQRGLSALRARVAEGAEEGRAAPAPPTASSTAAVSALQVYLQRRDAGVKVDVERFIADQAATSRDAEELRSLLSWVERIQALGPGSSR